MESFCCMFDGLSLKGACSTRDQGTRMFYAIDASFLKSEFNQSISFYGTSLHPARLLMIARNTV